MKSTFDKFFADNPQEKEVFDKEYAQFLLSELVLEKMEEEQISVGGFLPVGRIAYAEPAAKYSVSR